MRLAIGTRGRQRRVRRCHVQHPSLVLAQHHTVVRRTALPVLGQSVRDTGEVLGDAGVVRGRGHVFGPVLQLQHEAVKAGVQRALERLSHRARSARGVFAVLDGDALIGQLGAVQLIAQADPLLQRRHQSEHLEGGARLQTLLRIVQTLRVGAAVVRLDRARARVDGNHRRPQVRILALQGGVDRVLGSLLRLGVDGCGDLQALGVQGLLVDVEQIGELGHHLALDQTVGTGSRILCRGLLRRHRRRIHLPGAILSGQRTDGDHAVEHPVPAIRGLGQIHRGIQTGRPLDQRSQQRTLGHRQLLDRLVEVGLRRRRDAVGTATEVDDVEVGLHHLVLGPRLRHLGGDHDLLGLTGQAAQAGALRTDHRVLHILLGDGRPALGIAAEHVVLDGAQQTRKREARVAVEVAILGGHHGRPHVLRHLVDLDIDPVPFRWHNFREFCGAVAGQDGGHLAGTDVPRLGDVHHRVRQGECRQWNHDGQQHQGNHHIAEDFPAVALSLTATLRGARRTARPAGCARRWWRLMSPATVFVAFQRGTRGGHGVIVAPVQRQILDGVQDRCRTIVRAGGAR
ncbi:Uncharacterised protein [Mycobacteroides abscessus subsp. massiliense]|nr:Uncharacterised protein [Mycobacteroides abscessus subsp. massiliense]SLC85059.1 Uncharacterised protein [Mycobacteroides abscessus subsp. massiliense]